ncbi:glycosyltransferase family 4 protein [Bacillus sp. FJAT-49705]|uniref:Glycosyltransferase family 4 protein n=1 Tax=Cytobacillus citreus TaxID=2833586 RepID=A0ABS5NXY8_9BACI|nr:glycosyltransferase family 1 protein [Cytobacillus citreus]MBS4192695.1 glycosyltransferase family 4 protein [Cytobacillus citreus]
MRVGVNLLGLSQDKFGGAEQYIKNLILNLANQDEDIELFLFLKENIDILPNQIKKFVFKQPVRQFQIYSAIQMLQLDLWFCPLHKSYLSAIPVPTVVTIHDCLHTFYPEFVPGGLEGNNEYYKKFAQSFDAVITVSEFSKKSISERLHIPKEKIHAIHLDVAERFNNATNLRTKELIKAKYKLPDAYALYPASYNQHKNHLNLLKALVTLRDRYKKTIPLVLTGYFYKGNQLLPTIINFLNEHHLTEQVKILGYIPEQDLPYIYRNADFLIFPSLFEGFGLPLVEAMKTQTPIVCSNRGSIPEVVDDAALLFNPESAEDIAMKMMNALNPMTRIELIQKGNERANAFSWEKCAKETLSVFRGVLS